MSEPDTENPLTTAIAQLWPLLPELAPGAREEIEGAVLDGLRRISMAEAALAEAVDDDAADAAEEELDEALLDLRAVFTPYKEAARRLNRLWTEAMSGARGHGPTGPAGSVRNHLFLEVPVFYATNRGRVPETDDPDGGGWYTGDHASPDKLSFGVVRVSVPERRRRGRLPKPRLWHLGFNPRRFVEVIGVDETDEAAYLADRHLARTDPAGPPWRADGADEADERDILLFVHGFNVTFTDAAQRTAQLAYDINFLGMTMLFSWASKGMGPAYVADRDNAYAGVDHLVSFLRSILARLGPRRIHVIAHSMGNYVLIEALRLLDPAEAERLGHVVMVAPDVSELMFNRRMTAFGALAARCTVYTSVRDRALQASAWLSANPRAGQAASQARPVAVIDTIDTSKLGGDLLNHSTFAKNPVFLNDIEALVGLGRPAAQRAGLRPASGPAGASYWILDA